MTASPATYPLLSYDDLLNLPDPEWLIDGLVPLSGLSVLYGQPSAGKSFLALDWALSVATGQGWLDRKVKPRWVVYVAAEGLSGLKLRARAWHETHGQPRLDRVRWLAEAVDLRDKELLPRVRATLATLPEAPALLVVDTMARAIPGGDENSAKDVGELIAAVDWLRNGNAALVIHHTGREGGRERGSSALRGAADMMAMLERDEKTSRLELSCDKLKDAAEWRPIPLTLEIAQGSCVVQLRTIVTDAGEEQTDDLQGRVLEYVREHQPASGNSVADGIKRRRKAVLDALKALQARGEVHRSSRGWQVVPASPEPLWNHPSAANGGGGSRGGGAPVGGPPEEPPHAGSHATVPNEGEPSGPRELPIGPHGEDLRGAA
jgi:hypothetical protein